MVSVYRALPDTPLLNRAMAVGHTPGFFGVYVGMRFVYSPIILMSKAFFRFPSHSQ
jgi:hypothetical protein